MAEDPNPAATVYADTIAQAADALGTVHATSGDEIMTMMGTLGGIVPEHPSEIRPAAPAAPAFDVSDLIKLAIVLALATWIGAALLGGKD